MEKEIRILIADDSKADAELVIRELGKGNLAHTTKWVKSEEEFLKALEEYVPDVILCDYKIPGLGAPKALKIVQERLPQTPFIVISGTIGEEIVVEMIRAGAVDYVMKDKLLQLVPAVQRALTEVVDRRKAEVLLRTSREYLARIIDAVADPIFVKDRQHRWMLVNKAFCEFMGHAPEELHGKSDYEFFPKAEAEVFWAKDEEVFRSGEENVNEEFFTDGAGVRRTILTKKTLYKDPDGKDHIVGVIRDITERKKMEKEAEKRLWELEIFYKASMGREERIIELKNEILGLKEKLAKEERGK